MLTLLQYLSRNKLKNILYYHESGELNVDYLQALSSISPDTWIVVVTKDRSINRHQYRKKFEVIYNDIATYKVPFKFDVLFSNNKNVTEIMFTKAKRVVSVVPFNYPIDDTILEFYIPVNWISWMPLFIQTFLCRYKLFADKTLKLIMRSIK